MDYGRDDNSDDDEGEGEDAMMMMSSSEEEEEEDTVRSTDLISSHLPGSELSDRPPRLMVLN